MVRYRKPDGKQTDKRGFIRKHDAEQWLAHTVVAKVRGEYVQPSDSRRTVNSLGPDWLARQRGHLKPSSYAPMEVAWRLRVQPRWGAIALGKIQPSEIQAWLVELGDGWAGMKPVGASVIIRSHQAISGILSDAVRDRLIPRNPAKGMKLPRKMKKPHTYLTHRQVDALASASGQYEALVLLLAYTGLRFSEAAALRLKDLRLDRQNPSVMVNENAVQVGSVVHVGTPKSHKTRTVPIPAFLVSSLERQSAVLSRDDLVFPGPDGNYMVRPHTISGWFDKAVIAAGVPKLTPNDLRHSAASLSVSAGANVKAIQRMLGHSSAAMTLDTYADLFDDDLVAVAERLDAARTAAMGV